MWQLKTERCKDIRDPYHNLESAVEGAVELTTFRRDRDMNFSTLYVENTEEDKLDAVAIEGVAYYPREGK